MKHLKKTLGLLLAATLLLSLAVPALAAEVQVSTQTLTVNGVEVPCEKYNIDGNNYFKLRDLAYVLSDTASRFEVGYDEASATVSIITGAAYTPNGTEMTAGADNSATAQVSAQTIMIDGVAVSDLSVYNIGGSNYFMLRDLAGELGFAVGYDEDTRTITVTAAPYDEAEAYYGTGLLAYDRGDYGAAIEWFTKAAEMGYAPAQTFMANCYYFGNENVEPDHAKAVEWFAKAAEQGYAPAQTGLGCCYSEGDGVKQDYAKAVEWWTKAAEQGESYAQACLGEAYEYGLGVKKDPKQSEYWYDLAAGQGMTKDEYYYQGGISGYQLGRYPEAAEYFRKAAELGHVQAQLDLAGCYEYGTGVEMDYIIAFEWFMKAAEQGNMYAQWRVGNAYMDAWGVNQDYEAGIDWLRRVAEQGYVSALTDLGYYYAMGLGVEQDYAAAIELWLQAAEQGEPVAQANLGEAYELGHGVEIDLEQSEYWYGLAAAQGVTKEYLEELAANQPVG